MNLPAAPAYRDALVNALLDFFFPPHCAICGELGAWLCETCIETMRDRGATLTCSSLPRGIAALGAATPHLGPARQVVHQLKYGGMRVLAAPMAALMAAACPGLLSQASIIIPVPLHANRVRRRGYNQAVLLAEALAAHTGLAVMPMAVERLRDTRSQVGLSRAERQANVAGAFAVHGEVAGASVLLVDDVCTTGATLSACAVALQQAGASQVAALTFARALPGAAHP